MTPRYTDNYNLISFKFSRFSMAKGYTPKSATKGLALAIACVLGIALPHAASAETLFGMDVNEVNANVFEVIPTGAESGLAYWCAAAAYAEQNLGGESTAELYIARGVGPAESADRTDAVQFTLDPAAAGITPEPLSADENTFNVGGHMQLGNARDSCE